MLVNNQINFPPVLTDKTFQKNKKHVCFKHLSIYHKTKFSLVRDGRNHIAFKALPCPWNNRSNPFAPITLSYRMVRAKTHLIPPENQGLIALCLRSNTRVFLFKPFFNRYRASLKCFSNRFLRCKPPLGQISPNLPFGSTHSKTLFDQSPDCFTSPKVERKLQLVRETALNREDDL